MRLSTKAYFFRQFGDDIIMIHYNEEQKPVMEIYTYHNDTTSIESLSYENGRLVSKRILNKGNGRETVRYYQPDDFVSSEKVYVGDSLIREVVFSRDDRGNILAKLIK